MAGKFDAIEKAAAAAANRCRGLAGQIASELRNKSPEHFVDNLSLANFYASLEHAADVLRHKGQPSVDCALEETSATRRFASAARYSSKPG
jgi:hypothetical protein